MRNTSFLPQIVTVIALLTCANGSAATSTSKACTDQSRACLESVARAYIDGLLSHTGGKIPLASDVRRTENALTNAKGTDQVRESFVRTDMVKAANNVRFITDVTKGEVVAIFLLDVDLKQDNGGGSGTTKAGDTEYKVSIIKPAGTYTVHEAERFKVVRGKITEIEIIAHVEDGKGRGSGWPVERDAAVKKGTQ